MLNGILISPEPRTLGFLQKEAIDSETLVLGYSYDRYPAAGELLRMISTLETHVVILDTDDPQVAGNLLNTLRECSPKTSVIDVSAHTTSSDFRDAVETVARQQRFVCPHLYTFLPAKAGSGCSTIALNTGAALSEHGKRTLLMEADLRSGSLSIALNLQLRGAIQQALSEEAVQSFSWGDMTVAMGKLDLLLSDRTSPKELPAPEDYRRILDFIAPRYEAIVVDLPELVNTATAELVSQAQNVFVVCTQEVLSLKLAERRFQELAGFGVQPDRIKVLINRWQRAELPCEDVARLLKRPVSAIFPNDYKSVRETIMKGSTVPPQSELGASFQQFAAQLVNAPGRKEAVKRWPMARMLKFLVRSQAVQPA